VSQFNPLVNGQPTGAFWRHPLAARRGRRQNGTSGPPYRAARRCWGRWSICGGADRTVDGAIAEISTALQSRGHRL
jgi:hypothetical protein